MIYITKSFVMKFIHFKYPLESFMKIKWNGMNVKEIK